MANPFLNDKAAAEASRAGWAAPEAGSRSTAIDDGPISPWHSQTMTSGGAATATGVLFVLLLASAALGWASVKTNAGQVVTFPGIAFLGIIIGFAAVITMRFKPTWAKVLGPLYALAEGFAVGAISKAYETYQHGIVLQAVGATIGVFAVMLFLYKTRILKVTDRFRRIVVTAALGLMVFYGVALLMRLFGGSGAVSFLNSTSGLSIAFSVFAAGVAAMMLAVDFDQIDRGVRAGWPKGMEWYCATGLLVTTVWLYLELLRLLSKLQRR